MNHSGSVWVDTNGNLVSDPDNLDYTNRDITYMLGYTTDNLFAGNFSGPGPDGTYGTADDAPPRPAMRSRTGSTSWRPTARSAAVSAG